MQTEKLKESGSRKLDCVLIVLGSKVLLETTCRRNVALKVFEVNEGFQAEVMEYIRDNHINIVNSDSFTFLM